MRLNQPLVLVVQAAAPHPPPRPAAALGHFLVIPATGRRTLQHPGASWMRRTTIVIHVRRTTLVIWMSQAKWWCLECPSPSTPTGQPPGSCRRGSLDSSSSRASQSRTFTHHKRARHNSQTRRHQERGSREIIKYIWLTLGRRLLRATGAPRLPRVSGASLSPPGQCTGLGERSRQAVGIEPLSTRIDAPSLGM